MWQLLCVKKCSLSVWILLTETFFASENICHRYADNDGLIYLNSLDPDQDQQGVGPDRDPYCLTF